VNVEFYGGHEVYSESGIDLTLLHERMTLTVTERWQANAPALEFAEATRPNALNGMPSCKLDRKNHFQE